MKEDEAFEKQWQVFWYALAHLKAFEHIVDWLAGHW